jgi:hypothetical protein
MDFNEFDSIEGRRLSYVLVPCHHQHQHGVGVNIRDHFLELFQESMTFENLLFVQYINQHCGHIHLIRMAYFYIR